MGFTPLEVASLKPSLAIWETVEYLATVIVIAGVIGEYVAEFTRFAKARSIEGILGKISTLVLIVGLSFELLGMVRTSQVSGQLIASLEVQISDTNGKAAQATQRAAEAEQEAEGLRQVSGSEARMRMGLRTGMDELDTLMRSANDSNVVRFAQSALETASRDFESGIGTATTPSATRGRTTGMLWLHDNRFGDRWEPKLSEIVHIVNDDPDLNAVAWAFDAFREMTHRKVKMFDFAAIRYWCAQNKPKCEQ